MSNGQNGVIPQSQPQSQSQRNPSKIIEVYESNFIQEIKHMSTYLEEYNYIGMDTEFPGVVYKLDNYSADFYYKSIKLNVDELKLIQLGITLSNAKGDNPPECCTWQFNLRFDTKKDKYSQESITLLVNSGIKFDQLKAKGIPHKLFAEYLMVSGLILNKNIQWISYHGSYDFAYLLKLILNSPLPATESEFTETLSLYFPCHYDIRILVQGKEQFKGGLNKLAQLLDIYRTGEVHQAGSDSIVTADIFFSLINNNIIPIETLPNYMNILYGIGEGEDNNETILYTSFNNNGVSNNSTLMSQGLSQGLSQSGENDKRTMYHHNHHSSHSPNPYGQYPQSSIPLSANSTAFYPYMNYAKGVVPLNNVNANVNVNVNGNVNGAYILGLNPNMMPMNSIPHQNGMMQGYPNYVAL